jgi:hypothetical protein
MSLTELVQKTRQLKAEHPKASNLDWHDCAYLALHEQFGVEPSQEEIAELAKAALITGKAAMAFPQERDTEAEAAPERQTGGGRRILHKPGFLGG